jgi:hypothetical protein
VAGDAVLTAGHVASTNASSAATRRGRNLPERAGLVKPISAHNPGRSGFVSPNVRRGIWTIRSSDPQPAFGGSRSVASAAMCRPITAQRPDCSSNMHAHAKVVAFVLWRPRHEQPVGFQRRRLQAAVAQQQSVTGKVGCFAAGQLARAETADQLTRARHEVDPPEVSPLAR